MTISTNAFLRAMDDIIPVLENSDLRFNVTEVLSETRYEFLRFRIHFLDSGARFLDQQKGPLKTIGGRPGILMMCLHHKSQID